MDIKKLESLVEEQNYYKTLNLITDYIESQEDIETFRTKVWQLIYEKDKKMDEEDKFENIKKYNQLYFLLTLDGLIGGIKELVMDKEKALENWKQQKKDELIKQYEKELEEKL